MIHILKTKVVSHTLLLSFAFLIQQQNVLNVFPSQQLAFILPNSGCPLFHYVIVLLYIIALQWTDLGHSFQKL